MTTRRLIATAATFAFVATLAHGAIFLKEDAAGAGRSNGFFGDCPDVALLARRHSDALEEMIRRDKNHPSVIAWSVFNEAETITQASHDYFAPLFALARQRDPQGRPVTGVLEKTSSPKQCRCWPSSV